MQKSGDTKELPLDTAPRFSRERWLRAAMEVLANDGQAKLRIDDIAASLGVTKGSFYHHFKSREDFVESILAFWAESFTDYVVKTIEELEGNGEHKLLELTRLVEREGLDRYDIAFRSWAAQDRKVADVVEQVDAARYSFIESLFRDMGFKEPDLGMRVQIWLVYASAHRTLRLPKKAGSEEDLMRRHRFFTR